MSKHRSTRLGSKFKFKVLNSNACATFQPGPDNGPENWCTPNQLGIRFKVWHRLDLVLSSIFGKGRCGQNLIDVTYSSCLHCLPFHACPMKQLSYLGPNSCPVYSVKK